MHRTGIPYGEARRLRYFTLVCEQLLVSRSVDIGFLTARILPVAKRINPELERHARKTGVMRTRAVARNYIDFCDWLGFLQFDGRLVTPNGLTVFVANIDSRKDFSLSKREKIGLFLRIIEKQEIKQLLSSLRLKNRVKDYTSLFSEHFVESFFEWFVDLEVLRPSSRAFGYFILTPGGYQSRESFVTSKSELETSRAFSSFVLGRDISVGLSISDSRVREVILSSLQRLSSHIRSELDSSLYSALPILLDAQLEVAVKYHQLAPLRALIERLEHLSRSENMIFKWDPFTKRGYLKVQVGQFGSKI